MKLIQLAALFGGIVSAVQPLAAPRVHRALSDITTAVVLITSTYTVTKCATDATNCPASATVLQTSTTVVSVTTTICSLTSTPGVQPPASGVSPTSVPSPALPSGSIDFSVSFLPPSPTTSIALPVESASSIWVSISIISSESSISMPLTTNTLSDAVPTSFPPDVHGTSNGYVPPHSSVLPTFSLPGTDTSSIGSLGSDVPVSSVFVTASVPGTSVSTATVAVSTSSGASSSGYSPPSSSAGITLVPTNTNTDSVPTSFPVSSARPSSAGPSSGGYAIPSGSSAASTTTSTDYVPTFPVSSSVPSSTGSSSSGSVLPPGSSAAPSSTVSGGVPSSSSLRGPGSTTAAPTQGTSSAAQGTSSGSSPITSSPSLSTILGTQPVITSVSSGYSAPPPTESDSSEIDSTIRITSYLTHTWTSVITVQPPSSKSNTNSDTLAVPTSYPSSVSALPSGSGYPYPSGSGNGTIISPKPTYSEMPINMGQVVGARKSSLAAIVVALAFAHFA